jgi:hypothetical protein
LLATNVDRHCFHGCGCGSGSIDGARTCSCGGDHA